MDQATTPPPSRFHQLIIGLLFVVLLGTLTLIALLVTRPKAEGTPITAASCKEFVDAARKEAEDACQNDGQPQEPETKTENVPAADGTVGFDYPADWSVEVGRNVVNGPSWYAAMVPTYFFRCDGCDGPARDIVMTVGNKNESFISSYPDFRSYLNALYDDKTVYSNIVITPSRDVGGERYTVTGHVDGLYAGDFETIYFEGPTQYASIDFFDIDPADGGPEAAWELVKGSLDFSGIQQ